MSLNSTGKLGYDHVTDFNALAGMQDADLEKLATYESLELAVNGFNVDNTNSFFTITSASKGLLVDTTKGKFQTDLSLLFAGNNLPTAYRGNHLYSNSGTPLATRPSRFKGSYTGGTEEKHIQPLPSPDPTWDLLHSHYRLYRDLNTGGSFSLPLGNTQTNITDEDTGETRVTPLFTYGDDDTFHLLNNPAKDRNADFENNQQILPVVSNAQFIYSLTNRWDPREDRLNNRRLMLVTDAVVTLWNPYNVSIDVDNMELEFYRFPAEFKFYKGMSASSLSAVAGDHYTNVANMHNVNNVVGVGAEAPWELRNVAPIRVRISGAKLSPGEFRVFGPTDFNENTPSNNPISNHGSTNVSHGMILTNSFDETAGGSYTAVLVSTESGGAPSTASSTAIAIADGEFASVAARSGTVTQGGGLLDFNRESPAAYINIYLGDGGDVAPASKSETDYDRMLDDLFKNGGRQPIGSIALTPNNLNTIMPDIPVEDTPTYEIQTYATAGNQWEDFYSEKVPMVIASLRLKSEQGSNNVGAAGASTSRQWLNNGITNTYAVNGFSEDQDIDSQNMQYELTWEPMTDWLSAPAIEHTEGVAYGGTGHTAQDGLHQAVVCQIPVAPYSSISQFSHAPINKSGIAPLTTQIIGNSFASPVFNRDQKQATYANLRTSYLDHSYLANSTLFDGYFISTAVNERDVPISNNNRALNDVTDEFFTGVEKLHNSNYEPITSTEPDNLDYDNFAAYLYNKGAFNVNSTSVEAWSLLLASAQQDNLPLFNILTGSSTIRDSASRDDNLVAFSRFSPMAGDNSDLNETSANSSTRWSGVSRRLTTAQINPFRIRKSPTRINCFRQQWSYPKRNRTIRT